MEWSDIFSGVALVISVTSPIVSTIMNNHHEKIMWNKRSSAERKNIAIQNYIRKSGLALKRTNVASITEYSESYGEIFLYAPSDLWEDIEKLDSYIIQRSPCEAAYNLHVSICKRLSAN